MIILLILFCMGAFIGLSLLAAVSICAKRHYPVKKSDCIIVLGAKVWPDGRMSNTLLYRCEKALKAWQDGISKTIIVCGGRVQDEPETEASAMARWFEEKGVPSESILREDKSADTRENMNNARIFMNKNSMKTAVICTSDYHLTRAMWLAKHIGIEACGIPAPSPKTMYGFIMGRVREVVGWVLYFFRLI